MEYNEQYNFIRSFLQPDEIVLWHGAPGSGKLKAYGQVPILFSVIWLGFSLIWEAIAIWNGIWIMILFGIPFLLVGLSVTFGGSVKAAKLKGKIFYAVTDQRLLIIEGEDVSMFTADMLPPMKVRMNKNGTGTILFESTYRTYNGSRYNCVCSLQNLTDAEQAQKALNTMISKNS